MPNFGENVTCECGHANHVGECRSRLRIEVDAKLVGLIERGRLLGEPYRPRVERDGAHLRAPQRRPPPPKGTVPQAVRPDGKVTRAVRT